MYEVATGKSRYLVRSHMCPSARAIACDMSCPNDETFPALAFIAPLALTPEVQTEQASTTGFV